MSSTLSKAADIIRNKFRFSTLSFIFIIAYVNIFQRIFGPENSIAGVIFTILMSASMVRDLTATPVKHLFIQALVLVWMAVAAYLVTVLNVPLSFLVNFVTLLVILYSFTFEYASHIYFPYILSYLFLIFISPVSASKLPGRIAGMLAGAASILLYQWFMGRKRIDETAKDVLSEMIDDILLSISCKLTGTPREPDVAEMRSKLCRLSRCVYERRKKVLCVSDASFAMVDAGRGLENLLMLIHELPDNLSSHEKELLFETSDKLRIYHAFMQQERTDLPEFAPSGTFDFTSDDVTGQYCHTLLYIQAKLLHMTDPESKGRYRKTGLSLKVRLQAAMDLSPVRAIYAFRVALLLSGATLLVQLLGLPHGRWLLFTLASVSLPYADDVPVKIRKRVLATIMGGLISLAVYSLVPSPAGRTAAMMLSGYASFYFTDYAETFACSTVGALGGAVFMDAFGFKAVGAMFLIRLGYILAGVILAFAINCLIFPYGRKKATKALWEKYKTVSCLLTRVVQEANVDPQLYYSLVIQAHMQEEKLAQNADIEEWNEMHDLLARCQEQVRRAHRKAVATKAHAPTVCT